MSEAKKIIEVGMGKMEVAHNNAILKSSGIGSCVVITIYDPVRKMGGLVHAMLKKENPLHGNFLRYVESAIEAAVSRLKGLGSEKEDLWAKIIGGASMFSLPSENKGGIGAQNLQAARDKLKKEEIKLIAEDTGGTCGRNVEFDLETGTVSVTTKM